MKKICQKIVINIYYENQSSLVACSLFGQLPVLLTYHETGNEILHCGPGPFLEASSWSPTWQVDRPVPKR